MNHEPWGSAARPNDRDGPQDGREGNSCGAESGESESKLTQPNLAHCEKQRLARVFFLGTGLFIAVGYALYFSACLLPPPVWALELIEALKPTFGSLVKSEHVSNSPFPAQVVIVYAAFSSVALMIWFGCWLLIDKEYRCATQRNMYTKTRIKLLVIALGNVFLLFPGWIWFISNKNINIGWQARALFSSNLTSVSLHLLSWVIMSLIIPFGIYALWTALTWQRSRATNFPFVSK